MIGQALTSSWKQLTVLEGWRQNNGLTETRLARKEENRGHCLFPACHTNERECLLLMLAVKDSLQVQQEMPFSSTMPWNISKGGRLQRRLFPVNNCVERQQNIQNTLSHAISWDLSFSPLSHSRTRRYLHRNCVSQWHFPFHSSSQHAIFLNATFQSLAFQSLQV